MTPAQWRGLVSRAENIQRDLECAAVDKAALNSFWVYWYRRAEYRSGRLKTRALELIAGGFAVAGEVSMGPPHDPYVRLVVITAPTPLHS
jgi:hypothetical protein